MSCYNFKTLNLDMLIWRSPNTDQSRQSSRELKLSILESLLRRCGKFLTQIIGFLDVQSAYVHTVYQDIIFLNLINKECPNLKTLDMDYCFFDNNCIRRLEPIFKKVKRFRCNIIQEWCIDDKKLRDLFSQNTILESFHVFWDNESIEIFGDFINAISHRTIKELVYIEKDESNFSIYNILQVRKIITSYPNKVGRLWQVYKREFETLKIVTKP